jgi:hypothetical protein
MSKERNLKRRVEKKMNNTGRSVKKEGKPTEDSL